METESKTPAYDALTEKEQAWIEDYFVCGMNQTEASRRYGSKAPEQHGWRMSKNVDIQAAIKERLEGLKIAANEVLYRIQERARGTAADFLIFEEKQYKDKEWVPAEEAIRRLRKEIEIESVVAARLELDGEAMEKVEQQIDEIERRIVRLEVKIDKAEEGEDVYVLVDGPLLTLTQPDFDLSKMREQGKLHLIKSVKRDKDGAFKVDLYDAHAADIDLAKHLALFGPDGSADDPIHERHTIEIINQQEPRRAGNLDLPEDA